METAKLNGLRLGGDFDGETYSRLLDKLRLTGQLRAVAEVLADQQWHTLRELADRCGGSEAGVSARLRDLRKERFGGFEVERERVAETGLWRYRLVLPTPPAPEQGKLPWR